jgi:hypothetical protein
MSPFPVKGGGLLGFAQESSFLAGGVDADSFGTTRDGRPLYSWFLTEKNFLTIYLFGVKKEYWV